MKDAGLHIRVQRELRDQFLEACRAEDKPAAQVLREFMRHYVAHCSSGAKTALLGASSVPWGDNRGIHPKKQKHDR